MTGCCSWWILGVLRRVPPSPPPPWCIRDFTFCIGFCIENWDGRLYVFSSGVGKVHRGPGAELPRPLWSFESSQMIMVNNCQQPGQHKSEGYQHGHYRHHHQQQMIIMHQHVSQQLGNPYGNRLSGLQDSHQVYGYYHHGRQQMMYEHGIPMRHNYHPVPPQLGHLQQQQQQQQGQMTYEYGMQVCPPGYLFPRGSLVHGSV